MAHLLPKLFPHAVQLQENGFSLVCVLSCLCTCSTRLHEKIYVSSGENASRQARRGSYLNHLLQYLHGRVFGFGSLTFPLPSRLFEGLDPCGDWTESILISSKVKIGGMELVTDHASRAWGSSKWAVATVVTAPMWKSELNWCRLLVGDMREHASSRCGGYPLSSQIYPSSQKQAFRPVPVFVVLPKGHKLMRYVTLLEEGVGPWWEPCTGMRPQYSSVNPGQVVVIQTIQYRCMVACCGGEVTQGTRKMNSSGRSGLVASHRCMCGMSPNSVARPQGKSFRAFARQYATLLCQETGN